MADEPAGPPKKRPPDDASTLRMLGAASGVGFEFLAAVLLPGALGYWLDGKLGSRPWLMIGLGVVGFAAGLYRMLRTAKEQSK